MKKIHHVRYMLTSKLPSLKALHVFSVASQHMNFSQASEALCITPSAVSHQIKRLEDHLGCQLFEKVGNHNHLTKEAKEFAQQLNHAFTQIQQATNKLTHYQTNTINIGVNSAFAVKRLVPMLDRWQDKYPELDLRVRMLSCSDNLDLLELDMILGGKQTLKNYDSKFICEEEYYPVCSQSFFQNQLKSQIPDSITPFPLIDLSNVNCWEIWFKQHLSDNSFQTKPQKTKILYFSHTLMMIEAMMASRGIALIEKALIKNAINNREVVLLHKEGFTPSNSGYYLSVNKKRRKDHKLKNLSHWIFSLFESH